MYYIGVDLGGTNIAAGVVDSDYKILTKGSVPTNANRPSEEIIKDMADLCHKLVSEAKLTVNDIEYVGIASPGSIDHDKGTVLRAENLHFENFSIVETLKKYFPVNRVLLENDANAAALGEAVAGAARGVAHVVMVTLGTGVGGGIIIDHKVYSGFNFTGGELGHICIEYNGRLCTCGQKGCWEAYSSATALINMTGEKIDECEANGIHTLMTDIVKKDGKISGKTAFAAMKQGDAPAADVVDMYISYLACGIVNIINIFQPEILVIGGGICNEGDNLTKPLDEKVFESTFTGRRTKTTTIKIAELGNDAGIIGAAALGI